MKKRKFVQVLNIIQEIEGTSEHGELARRLGVDKATLSAWKKRGTVSAKGLADWCHKHGKPVDWILYEPEEGDGAVHWIGEADASEYGAKSVLDERVLSFALEALEESLEHQQMKLPPKIKAAIAARIYHRKMNGQDLELSDLVKLMGLITGEKKKRSD